MANLRADTLHRTGTATSPVRQLVVVQGGGKNASYFDDNFGHYEINSQDDVDFYHEIQRTSRAKKCVDCGRKVRLQPQYECCDPCAQRRERGGGY